MVGTILEDLTTIHETTSDLMSAWREKNIPILQNHNLSLPLRAASLFAGDDKGNDNCHLSESPHLSGLSTLLVGAGGGLASGLARPPARHTDTRFPA